MREESESLYSLIATGAIAPNASLRKELEKMFRSVLRIREDLVVPLTVHEDFPEAAKTARAMISKGDLLDSVAFADRMAWSKQALSKALASHRVFFVEFEGTRYFPAFYADPNQERRHLEAVTKIMGDLPGSSKLQFFLNPRGSLSKLTPLQAVQRGMLTQVKNAAAGFAEA